MRGTDPSRESMPEAPRETWITSPAGLGALADELRAEGRFAFDTEFVSETTFEPVLCLVQVATPRKLAVVDPMAVEDLSPFWDVVTDPAVEVVTHAAGEDLRICQLKARRLPARVVDVQVAAGLVGFGYPASLVTLVQQVLGVTLAGGETRTDWRRRPLSPAQLRYALDDVRHLLDLADRLAERLAALGRAAWADAEYTGLLESIGSRDDEDRWRRLPSLQQLSRRGLEAARRLYEWRREEARRINRPVRSVMRDDLLVGIAKRQPSSIRDLEALRDFSRHQHGGRAACILDVIAEAREVPDEQLPARPERFDEGPGLGMVVSLLAATLNHCCARQKVSASLVGTASDLKELVRWYGDGQPAGRLPTLLRGWRGEVCGRTLLDVLSGRRALRIVDPNAEVPVALDDLEAPNAAQASSP